MRNELARIGRALAESYAPNYCTVREIVSVSVIEPDVPVTEMV
jgi:hypothetical protein